MSYLPHSGSATGSWAVAWGTSGVLHAGLFGLLISSYIPFLPELDGQPPQFESFLVSFEIRDSNVIPDIEAPSSDALDALTDAALEPSLAQPDTFEDLGATLEPETATPDATALEPQVSPGIAPILDLPTDPDPLSSGALALPSDAPLQPSAIIPEASNDPIVLPDATNDELSETELSSRAPAVAQDPVLPTGASPSDTNSAEAVVEPSDLAVVTAAEDRALEGQAPRTLQQDELVATPTPVPAQRDDRSLIVDDVSIVDDIDVSPLAEGGAAVSPDTFADGPTAATVQPTPLAPLANTIAPLDPTTSTAESATEIGPNPPLTGLVTLPATTTPSTETASGGLALPQQPTSTGENLAALVPDAQTPLDPNASGQVGLAPTVLQPDAAFDDTGTIGVDATAIVSPSAGQVAMGQLLRRIRSVQAPQCTLALPRGVAPDGIGLSLIGAQDEVVSQYADRLLERDAPAVLQSRELIDARQCAVLDVIQANDSYPASRIGLNIERTQLSSGDDLRARVIGAGGLYITALLIDDNGVVQDLGRFATVDGANLTLDAPVARAGDARATRQILLVLGTRDAPLELTDQIGNLAQDVLPSIDAEALQGALFGLATFEVR